MMRLRGTLLLSATLIMLAGCGNNMRDGRRFKPYEASDFFEDGQSSRPLPDGVVARGHLDNGALFTGVDDKGQELKTNPLPVSKQVLDLGREKFNITCALCHGRDGYGQGIIVQRGFTRPPSLHDERLRTAADGHFFTVMTHGFGAMYPQIDRVDPRERWAVLHYIRALQLSQHATLSDAPENAARKLSAVEEHP